jgi:hypothetical protein
MVRRRTPRALRILTVIAVLASAVLGWMPVIARLPGANGHLLGCYPAYVPAIAMLLAVASLLDVSLPVGRGHWQVRGSDAGGAALLVLCPGPGLWLGAVLAAAVLMVGAKLTSRRRWRSMEYAAASALLQAGAATAVTCALRDAGLNTVGAAIGGVLAAAFTRHVMAAGGVALTARRSIIGLLLPRLPGAFFMALGNGAVGLLVGWLIVNAPAGLAGLAVPGLLVAGTSELQARRGAEARLFAALASEQQRLAGRSLEQSVAVLMTVTARLLGGADIELLLSGPEGLVRYTGDESGVSGRVRTDPSAFDAPWARQLLARGPVRIAIDEGRPYCAFSIGTGATPRAVVVARRPLGTSGFNHRDVVFARALARQAAPWLIPPPDLGPARDTRLEVVREIARRILRSPEPTVDPEWSGRLLDEVHSLERAVAALLGSAPGGAIPPQRDRRNEARPDGDFGETGSFSDGANPAMLDQDPDKAAAGPEWTTTGLLPGPHA